MGKKKREVARSSLKVQSKLLLFLKNVLIFDPTLSFKYLKILKEEKAQILQKIHF